MHRKQIAMATQLFDERDRIQSLIDIVASGKGIGVTITSTYQSAEVVQVVLPALRTHFQSQLNRINADLKQLGWSGA
jgi:hypothetical protein